MWWHMQLFKWRTTLWCWLTFIYPSNLKFRRFWMRGSYWELQFWFGKFTWTCYITTPVGSGKFVAKLVFWIVTQKHWAECSFVHVERLITNAVICSSKSLVRGCENAVQKGHSRVLGATALACWLMAVHLRTLQHVFWRNWGVVHCCTGKGLKWPIFWVDTQALKCAILRTHSTRPFFEKPLNSSLLKTSTIPSIFLHREWLVVHWQKFAVADLGFDPGLCACTITPSSVLCSLSCLFSALMQSLRCTPATIKYSWLYFVQFRNLYICSL